MPRRTTWHIGGQVVTRADVRRWMQSVAARVPARSWWAYVRDWGVPAKIARELEAGTLERTLADAAARAGVTVRAARRPGRIAALRAPWPIAANDESLAGGSPATDSPVSCRRSASVGAFAIAKAPAGSARRFWRRSQGAGSIRAPPRV